MTSDTEPRTAAGRRREGSTDERLLIATELLRDALRVQRQRCDHKGIGLPGCVICDPRVYPEAIASLRKPVTP